LVLLYLAIFTVATALSWRQLHLLRLPYIREPFDEAKYGTVEVPESANSLPLYLEAERLLVPYANDLKQLPDKAWNFDQWASLDPAIRRWVEASRPALGVWLRATERTDAFLIQPNRITIATRLEPQQAIRELAKLALFEGSRSLESGDLDGAWTYYRSVLRSSRHANLHGSVINRLIGYQTLRKSRPSVERWIDSPSTTPQMLRQAILDVEACQAMTPPMSEMIRNEYFMMKNTLNQTEHWSQYGFQRSEDQANWVYHLPGFVASKNFLLREPERSQRVLRLVTAGVLAQCDRPRWARPRFFNDQYWVYDLDARTPAAVASISPEALTRWAEDSAFSTISSPLNNIMSNLESEPGIFDNFRLRMAERGFQIEHGRPATTYGELLGSYLKELPEGIEAADPIGPPSVTK
jgi:hypothetical protein